MRKIKEHTLQKLKYFEKYLSAYLLATKKLPKKYYIDAFAGMGKCILDKTGKIIDGSVLIALKNKNSFNGYLFIEKDKKIYEELEKNIKEENINKERLENVKIKNEDSNDFLLNLYKRISENDGYLILLDPEGPELFWNTISHLSKINKADLLILYPYDMSLVRLAKNYPEMIDKFYGSHEWSNIYEQRKNAADANKKLLEFYINNLKKLGFYYTAYRQIRRGIRSGKPLYHLILATRSLVGVKIMADIFNKELDGQKKLLKS